MESTIAIWKCYGLENFRRCKQCSVPLCKLSGIWRLYGFIPDNSVSKQKTFGLDPKKTYR